MELKIYDLNEKLVETLDLDSRSFLNTIRTQLSEKYMVTNLALSYYNNTLEGLEERLNTKLSDNELKLLENIVEKENEKIILNIIKEYEATGTYETNGVREFYDMCLDVSVGALEDFSIFLEDYIKSKLSKLVLC